MSDILVTLSDRQYVYNTTPEQRNVLKGHLTVDNPAYKSAVRYSRIKSQYIRIPQKLYYYTEFSERKVGESERKKVLSVPIGVNVEELLGVKCEYVDTRNDIEVEYPPFVLDLREDQKEAESSYLRAQKDKIAKSIVQLPTGKGKSILALHIASVLKAKTLILVHKNDLVVGWKKDIELAFDKKLKAGLIKAQSRKVGDQITIATVQTLNRMSEEELEKYLSEFSLVVQDECHHVGIKVFNVIDKFKSRYKLGLSATPTRTDGLNEILDYILGGLCYTYEYVDNDEDISNVLVKLQDSKYSYRPFVYEGRVFNADDFKQEELPDEMLMLEQIPYEQRPRVSYAEIDSSVVNSKVYKAQVCKDIINEYNEGHSVIAMFKQKEHIDSYYSFLKQYIPQDKILLYYGDSKLDDKEMLKKAESKEVLVTLATYAKATEGTNVKSWEVMFLVSSVNNEKDTEQAIGRIRRRKEGKIDPVLVYDYRVKGYSISKHIETRLKVYKRLKCQIEDNRSSVLKKSRSVFSVGYN